VGEGASVGAEVGEGASVEVVEGAGVGEGEVSSDVHTAAITNSSLLHFVPAGTGFTNAAPLAHWYHQSPHSSKHWTESADTPSHCTSLEAEPEVEAPLQNSKVPSAFSAPQ